MSALSDADRSLPTGTVTFLFSDIEDSTRLWESQQDSMRLALASHDAIMRDAVGEHRGHLVKTTGDGMYAVFAIASDAIRACLSAQRALSELAVGEIRLKSRMALHSGNAELREGDYFGPVLNRASRLMAAAHGGQMLLSLAACELVGDDLPAGVAVRDLGERRLKDLIRPERVFQLVAADLASEFPPLRTLDARPNNLPAQTTAFVGREAEMSIAVLPFINISDDPANEYFADGLSEQLISVLSKIRGLRVVARSSSFTFKGKAATVAAVGDALNVATVLEGSVRKSGSLIRISVQLVDAGTDMHLWSETYDRTLDDIFAVQDDIARSVLMELRPTLLGAASDSKTGAELTAEVAAATRGRSTDPEAYRLFLQARYFIDRLTREDTAKGIEYLKEALAREVEFALAWAELGRAYANEADWGWAAADDGYRRAREAVERALLLEPNLAEAHAAMAWIRLARDWDFPGTEASCRRALELMPGNAAALQTASRLALFMGRQEEAVVLGRRAVEQDPLGAVAHYTFAATLWESGRSAEAVAALRLSLALAPQISNVRALLSDCLNSLGRADEAWAEALQEPTEAGRLWALAIIHYSAGRRAESDQALGELSKKYAEACSSQIAEVHALREENGLAFAWLEQARARRDPGVLSMKINPRLMSLHTDPRWGPFLHEIGLAD